MSACVTFVPAVKTVTSRLLSSALVLLWLVNRDPLAAASREVTWLPINRVVRLFWYLRGVCGASCQWCVVPLSQWQINEADWTSFTPRSVSRLVQRRAVYNCKRPNWTTITVYLQSKGSSINRVNTLGGGVTKCSRVITWGEGGGHRYVHVNIENRAISIPRAVIEPRQIDKKI